MVFWLLLPLLWSTVTTVTHWGSVHCRKALQRHFWPLTGHHSIHCLSDHTMDAPKIPISSLVEQMGKCLTISSVSEPIYKLPNFCAQALKCSILLNFFFPICWQASLFPFRGEMPKWLMSSNSSFLFSFCVFRPLLFKFYFIFLFLWVLLWEPQTSTQVVFSLDFHTNSPDRHKHFFLNKKTRLNLCWNLHAFITHTTFNVQSVSE